MIVKGFYDLTANFSLNNVAVSMPSQFFLHTIINNPNFHFFFLSWSCTPTISLDRILDNLVFFLTGFPIHRGWAPNQGDRSTSGFRDVDENYRENVHFHSQRAEGLQSGRGCRDWFPGQEKPRGLESWIVAGFRAQCHFKHEFSADKGQGLFDADVLCEFGDQGSGRKI